MTKNKGFGTGQTHLKSLCFSEIISAEALCNSYSTELHSASAEKLQRSRKGAQLERCSLHCLRVAAMAKQGREFKGVRKKKLNLMPVLIQA